MFNVLALKQYALRLGFDAVGIAPVEPLDKAAQRLEWWLKTQKHGKMAYMERTFEERTNPKKFFPEARSAIVLLHNYYYSMPYRYPKVAMYAWGYDYHWVLRKKAEQLTQWIQQQVGNALFKICIDSLPVMEKVWAQKAGLGWVGKNTNLIAKKSGSYFFIVVIFTDLVLEYDAPFEKDFCGRCQRCIEVCPTQALQPFVLDATRCISYWTIEVRKEPIEEPFRRQLQGWMFGCDLCQQVCPWNRFSKNHQEPLLEPLDHIKTFTLKDWLRLSSNQYKRLVRGTPLSRISKKKLQDTLQALMEYATEESSCT